MRMSGYSGRHGPNVSRYIANLNTIPTQQDLLAEPIPQEDDFTLFTNQEFWDQEQGFDYLNSPLDFDINADSRRASAVNTASSRPRRAGPGAEQPKMDFDLNTNLNSSDFQFADFSSFPNPIVDTSMQSLPRSQANYSVNPNFTSPVSASVSPVTPGFDQTTGKKRKLEDADSKDQQVLDEAARVAAEEDKRRRNTAASARFRVKKKQREQALEKTAKEMSERVTHLEARIQQLETENIWLKGLITEKNGGKTSASDLKAILSKHEETSSERSKGSHTEGVGTKSDA